MVAPFSVILQALSHKRAAKRMQLLAPALAGALLLFMAFVYTQSSTKSSDRKSHGDGVSEQRDGIRSLRSRPMTLSRLSQSRVVEDSAKIKPRLIFHVGPPKTGTTSLQFDLTHMQDVLAVDNYTYAGRQYQLYYNDKGRLVVDRTMPSLLMEAREMFQSCTLVPRSRCCAKFHRRLDVYQRRQQNVILSDESLNTNHFWKSPEDYQAMKKALQDDWNIVVVVGYRRFYEWIMSVKFQQDLLDQYYYKLWKNAWPGVDGGKPLQPVFPYLEMNRWRFPFTDAAVANARDSFPIEILSPYEDSFTSTRSVFLCHILKDANAACETSLRFDAHQEEAPLNRRATKTSFFYDAIATTAATRGLLNATLSTRRQAAAAIEQHQEKHLGLTAMDFDLICPSATELETLLHYSLQLEAEILPDTFVSMEEEHVAGFQRMVAAKAYCWVDTNAVLKQTEWKDFFARWQST